MTLAHDLRFALRTLARRRGLALAVILTLALGIGANSAVFSVVNAVLLRPLPFPAPERLVRAWGTHPNVGRESASLPDFRDWREGQQAVALAAMTNAAFNVTGAGEPQRVVGARATANLFDVLGAPPAPGRSFTPDEERQGQGLVAIVSRAFLRDHLGGSATAVGSTLTIDGKPHTLVGVAPESASVVFPDTEVWTPLAVDTPLAQAPRRGDFLHVFGRLAPGTSFEQARSALRTVAQRLSQSYPATNARWSTELVPLHDELTASARPALLLFLGAVLLVLLIACANVANLLLAQAAARQREMAIRSALGASRARLVLQLLTESAILAIAGGALGLWLASFGVEALALVRPESLRGIELGGLDLRVLAFTALVSLGSGLLFGIAPALRLSGNTDAGLRQKASLGPSGSGVRSLRGALVLAEVALALMLLVDAGLLVRSFERLQRVDPGFRSEGVLTGTLNLPSSGYGKDEARAAFAARLLGGLRAIPGVRAAAVTSSLPLDGQRDLSFGIEGMPPPGPGAPRDAETSSVSDDYFRALSIPIRAGRAFSATDVAGATDVAVVSETLVRRHFHGRDPLGMRVSLGGGRWFTIVGVAGDVRGESLQQEAYPQLYLPFAQLPSPRLSLAVLAAGEPTALGNALRREVHAIDSQLPVAQVSPLTDLLRGALAAPRVNLAVLGVFASIALLLAALGIYGVVSYGVTQRTREIGIRMALGARASDVLRMVVGQGMKPALVGVVAGLGGALATSHLMVSLLYGVGAIDPLTFAAVALFLLGVALLAAWLPARRATRVQPTEALRAE